MRAGYAGVDYKRNANKGIPEGVRKLAHDIGAPAAQETMITETRRAPAAAQSASSLKMSTVRAPAVRPCLDTATSPIKARSSNPRDTKQVDIEIASRTV